MQTFPQFRNYQIKKKKLKRLTLFQYLLEWFELDFFIPTGAIPTCMWFPTGYTYVKFRLDTGIQSNVSRSHGWKCV